VSETPLQPKDDRLLDHEYDGIHEYDNPLPRWWLYIFYATIAWAALYALNVPGIGNGKGRIANYARDLAAARAKYGEPAQSGGVPDDAALAAAAKDPQALALGRTTFTANCVACHGPEAGGVIGPNLTDDFWLHGGTPAEIYKTVHDGVLPKGMPAWGPVLKPEQVRAVVAFVLSRHDTHPANPKAPQGTRADGEGADGERHGD
jgi:cytochrome c oxidase cbb3-type subunit 3